MNFWDLLFKELSAFPEFSKLFLFSVLAFASGYIGLTWWFFVVSPKKRSDWVNLKIYDKIGIALLLGLFSFITLFLSWFTSIYLIWKLSIDIQTGLQSLMDLFNWCFIILLFLGPIYIGKNAVSKKAAPTFVSNLFSFWQYFKFFFIGLSVFSIFFSLVYTSKSLFVIGMFYPLISFLRLGYKKINSLFSC